MALNPLKDTRMPIVAFMKSAPRMKLLATLWLNRYHPQTSDINNSVPQIDSVLVRSVKNPTSSRRGIPLILREGFRGLEEGEGDPDIGQMTWRFCVSRLRKKMVEMCKLARMRENEKMTLSSKGCKRTVKYFFVGILSG